MLADVKKTENGYTARFERRFKHPVEKVWAFLTENEKLAQWFAELHVEELREGGIITFNMQDGSSLEMKILAYKRNEVLEYTWGEDTVRFELYPDPEGCRLVLIEKLNRITSHTPKDLAGWHVCLEVVHALLDGSTVESRKEAWEQWYVRYIEALKPFSS